jgi:hypothetical protein
MSQRPSASRAGSEVLYLEPVGDVGYEEEQGLFTALEARLEEGSSFTLLLDASRVTYVRPASLVSVPLFMRRHRDSALRSLRCTHIVATNDVVRTFLQALFALAPPATELVLHSTLADAVRRAYPLHPRAANLAETPAPPEAPVTQRRVTARGARGLDTEPP